MLFLPYIIILSIFISSVEFSVISNIKDNLLSFLKRSVDKENGKPFFELFHNKNGNKEKDNTNIGKNKNVFTSDNKNNEFEYDNINKRWLPKVRRLPNDKEYHRINPALNSLRRKSRSDYRRDLDSSDSSSSFEMKDWKEEWKEHWLQKKFQAINSSHLTGDHVNMVAARPWGVPCGDPNQHDMPWGSCMLPMECEAEYRIYRGDYFCGRTQFVCCALQINTYDMYQGFDVSFSDSSLATDSEEIKNRDNNSSGSKKRKKRRERKKRKKERMKRKNKIKKKIRKIIKEIRKILNRTYRNGTSSRKRKTKQLKKFIKGLKRQYLKDRQSVKDIHESEMIKIDADLKKRLDQMKEVNQNFAKNSTFRDMVVNGTVNQKSIRMLLQAYPDLSSYFAHRRSMPDNNYNDYLNYDIEYGLV